MKLKKIALATTSLVLLTNIVSADIRSKELTPFASVPIFMFKNVFIGPNQKDDVASINPASIHREIKLPPKPVIVIDPKPIVKTIQPKTVPQPVITGSFRLDREVSWYGPGFYGRRTACGLAYTKTILGVAHKTLPCGTLVTFKYTSGGVTRVRTVPVIDRGPYVAGRQWDLSGGLCVALHHCFTGPIYYRIK